MREQRRGRGWGRGGGGGDCWLADLTFCCDFGRATWDGNNNDWTES